MGPLSLGQSEPGGPIRGDVWEVMGYRVMEAWQTDHGESVGFCSVRWEGFEQKNPLSLEINGP